MDDQVLVRVLNGRAHHAEEIDARREREVALRAIAIDRYARDQLHHEIRLAVVGRAAVDQPRDVRMIEAREDLPFGAEPAYQAARSDAAAHDLDRHLLVKLIVRTHRAIHIAHAALTDQRDDLVRTDAPIEPALRPRLRERVRGVRDGWLIEKGRDTRVREERFDF